MTLNPTATEIYCQTCGTAWLKADDAGKFYFQSSSFAIGSYASPKSISDAAEEMTFCPSCDVDSLAPKETAPGRFESLFYGGDSHDVGDEEEGPEGDADVVNRTDPDTVYE